MQCMNSEGSRVSNKNSAGEKKYFARRKSLLPDGKVLCNYLMACRVRLLPE